jgi:hypothetical protein
MSISVLVPKLNTRDFQVQEISPVSPPPPYSARPVPRFVLPSRWYIQIPRDGSNELRVVSPAAEQLRRYILGIPALNFNVDFVALNVALNTTVAGTNFILQDRERADLLTLSRKVRKMREQIRKTHEFAIN